MKRTLENLLHSMQPVDSATDRTANGGLNRRIPHLYQCLLQFPPLSEYMSDPHASLADAKQTIIDEFSLFDGWIDRYEYIIELGRDLDGLDDSFRTEPYRVKGCQSQVWFLARKVDGRVIFEADSDAMIVRGLIALLLRVYSGRTPAEIIDTPPDFLEAIDLGSHLSGNRANGLASMVKHIQSYARSFEGDTPMASTSAP